jgi:pyrroline-5-carboxylate reductase
MPNIAAQFGASATCIAFHEKDKDKAQGVAVFQSLGTAPLLTKINGCSYCFASGTAFALRYIRASMQGY